MRIIEPRVSEASALAHFERREWKNLWGLFRVRSDPTKSPRLPRTQLVWLPHYIVTVLVDSKIGPGEIDVSVEAHSGSFAIFEMHENLEEKDEVEGEVFDLKIGEKEAVEIGRRELLKTILRRRGQREKPAIVGSGKVDLFYYPFWIYYYERRRGLLDIQIYDAARGEKGGARTKVGILSGLIGSDSEARASLEKFETEQ
ncbi:MAG: hypothetical protein H6751_07330 [Candidatus Omnitrophica bacterium]|nr:hypothetical protein [Candidatus Omnitrophota bacterium]